MLKPLALTASAALLLAGCSPSTTAPSAASPTSPASPVASTPAASASPSTAGAASPHSSPAKTTTGSNPGDAGDGGMLAGQGADADWKKLVTPCPGAGQKVIIQKVVTADVTGDGTFDAVVARSCTASTSYWPSTVEVFDGASQATAPRRAGTLLSDVGSADEPWVTALRTSGRDVVIEANGSDEHGSRACPDLKFTYRYTYTGGAFHRAARDVGNANTCLPVG